MEKNGLRLRLCVIAAVMACLALGLFAGSASAVLSMDRTTDTSLTIDEDVHWFGGTKSSVTYNGYQYFVYWDAPAERKGRPNLVLARRRLSDDNLVKILFTTEESYLKGIDDGHNEPEVAINRNDGTLHISWGNHMPFTEPDKRHYYWRSATRCIERTQAEFRRETCGFEFRFFQAERTLEEDMTYPQYITDNNGVLYFYYRNGLAPNSDSFINQYDETTHSWNLLGKILRGRSFGTYRFSIGETRYESRGRGAYPCGILFDKNNRMHVAWVWRELATEYVGQHGLFYAYSDDGGVTWYASDRPGGERERRIASTGTEPIDISDMEAAKVVTYPPGQMMTPGQMALDSNNNPHIANQVVETATNDPERIPARLRYLHMWRDNSGSWYQQYIGEYANGYGASLFFDRADIAYVLFARGDNGWIPWNSSEPFVDLPMDNVVWKSDERAGDGGALNVELYSENTYLDSEYVGVPISTTGNNQVRVRMRNDTTVRDGVITWVTDESTAWEVTRQKLFRGIITASDRNYTEYTFDMSRSAEWNGTLRTLEIGPCWGARTGRVSIDWIKVTDSSGRAVKTWNFERGYTLIGAEAPPGGNWGSWTIENLLPEVPLVQNSYSYRIDPQRFKDAGRPAEFPLIVQGSPGTESLAMRRFDITGDDEAKEWGFETDLMGWTALRDVTSFVKSRDRTNEVIGGTISGSDPIILSMPNLKTPIEAEDDFIHVRLKNTSRGTSARVFFITDTDRAWNGTKAQNATITRESTYTEYTFDMSRVSGWTGSTLYQLRIDPVDDGTSTGSFNIDRVYIYNR